MKTKIEVVANVIVILLAVVIGSVFFKDRFTTPAPESSQVKGGDRLPSMDGWDWGAHDRTLVFALRKGCHFCEDSAPFYQRLLAQQLCYLGARALARPFFPRPRPASTILVT